MHIGQLKGLVLVISRSLEITFTVPLKRKGGGGLGHNLYQKPHVLGTCRVLNLTEFNNLSPSFGRDINTVFVLKMKVNLA